MSLEYTLLAGFLAGIPAALLATPADVIKTRRQAKPSAGVPKYTTTVNTLSRIIAEEGFRGLWQGAGARQSLKYDDLYPRIFRIFGFWQFSIFTIISICVKKIAFNISIFNQTILKQWFPWAANPYQPEKAMSRVITRYFHSL